MFKKKNMQIG